MNKHLHVGPGGTSCRCCFPAPGSKARKAEFRKAKRRDERQAIATELEAMADEETARCASCNRWIEDGEKGPYCWHCRMYWEDYAAFAHDEYEREFMRAHEPADATD